MKIIKHSFPTFDPQLHHPTTWSQTGVYNNMVPKHELMSDYDLSMGR